MKRDCISAIKKLILLLAFLAAQVNVWAMETDNNANHRGSFFAQPWPWIPLIVTTIILLTGPFNYKRDFTVRLKKKKRVIKKQYMEKPGKSLL